MIKRFVRDEKNQPIGVLFAEALEGEIYFGWSMVHPKDKFNKTLGQKIALNRLKSGKEHGVVMVPLRAEDTMNQFVVQAMNKFKVDTPITVIRHPHMR